MALVAMNPAAKLALLPLALAATWTTAEAEDFAVTVTPTENLDHLFLYSAGQIYSFPMMSAAVDQTITTDLGPLTAGNTYSTTISTAYGTSAADDYPLTLESAELQVGALATTSAGDLALSSRTGSGSTYAMMFGTDTGVSQSAALTAATTGVMATAGSLYPVFSNNGLYSSKDQPAGLTATLYAFDSQGAARSIGTASIKPVPEPASLAALGLGALGLLRRRKK